MKLDDRRTARSLRPLRAPATPESGEHPVSTRPGPAEPGPSPRNTPLLPARPTAGGAARATLTVMTGMEAGRVVALDQDELVIGRDPGPAGLCIEDPGLSRRHARILRAANGTFEIEDLGSTNGTLVRGQRVARAALEPGDYVQLGGGLQVRFAMTDPADERLRRQLYESSINDPLTRVYNRRYFFARLDADVASARRTGGPLSLLMLDIDDFKRFNDTFGHMPGDRALCFVAAQIQRITRIGNVLARYGGEEFVVMSPDTTLPEAMRLAERIRRDVAGLKFSVAANTVSLTVSIGVASLAELGPDDGAAALVGLADQRLYAAKAAGRNRVQGS
jgi:two-component system, cell cycle response regulator